MENLQIMMKGACLVGLILLLTWFALRFKNRFLQQVQGARKGGSDPATFEMASKVLTILIALISLMLILQVLGLDVVPLLTLSGIGAAIVGFASKDVAANFFSGSMIYATRPFHLGDFIEIPSKKISGRVEEIGWYVTTLRDLQKKTVSLPNAIISTELVLNHSRITHRRIEEKLRFRTVEPSEIEKKIAQIRKIVETEVGIDQKEQVDVYLLSIGSFGWEVELKAYVKTVRYDEFMRIKERLLIAIANQTAS